MGSEIKNKEIIEKIKAGEDIKLRFSFDDSTVSAKLHDLLYQVISQLQLQFLQEAVASFLTESVQNAVKANARSIFIGEQQGQEGNEKDLAELTREFREVELEKIEEYVPALKKSDLFVEVTIRRSGETLEMMVVNNTPIMANEYGRIQDSLKKAEQYNSLEEAFKDANELESGGMGLKLNIIMLKKFGIGPAAYSLQSYDGHTYASLKVPTELGISPLIKQMMLNILQEVEGIPTFPEPVQKILKLCDNPDSNMSQIAKEVEKDTSLSAEFLRLVRSGGYVVSNKNLSIQQAVNMLGLKAIRSITVAAISRQIIDRHFKSYRNFWEHCQKCGYYARAIAEKYKHRKIADKVYMGGLFHDLGKLILHAIEPQAMVEISRLRLEVSNRPSAALEEISIGISHTRIGERIARHWNYPDDLVEMILHHHFAPGASEENRLGTYIVHLADWILLEEEQRGRHNFLTSGTLTEIGLEASELPALAEELKAAYEGAGSR